MCYAKHTVGPYYLDTELYTEGDLRTKAAPFRRHSLAVRWNSAVCDTASETQTCVDSYCRCCHLLAPLTTLQRNTNCTATVTKTAQRSTAN